MAELGFEPRNLLVQSEVFLYSSKAKLNSTS